MVIYLKLIAVNRTELDCIYAYGIVKLETNINSYSNYN